MRPIDASFDEQELAFVAELSARVCSENECSAPPVATYAAVTPIELGKVAYDVVWACAEHADGLHALAQDGMAEGTVVTGWVQELQGVCLSSECDSDATHVVFVARDYGPAARRLEAMSLCEEHAERIAQDLKRE